MIQRMQACRRILSTMYLSRAPIISSASSFCHVLRHTPCYTNPTTTLHNIRRFYSTAPEDEEGTAVPQWSLKLDFDIEQLKKSGNPITYETLEPLVNRTPITGKQAETLYELGQQHNVENLDKIFSRYIAVLFSHSKSDDVAKVTESWKAARPMTKDIYFALIDGYGKITEVTRALNIWEEMEKNNVPPSPQLFGVVMKLYERQGKKDHVLRLYERCKTLGIAASGAIYEAYINATIGYKPAKYRKKK